MLFQIFFAEFDEELWIATADTVVVHFEHKVTLIIVSIGTRNNLLPIRYSVSQCFKAFVRRTI